MSRRPISGVVARRLPICVLVKKIGCISISLPRMRRDGLGWVVFLRLVGGAVGFNATPRTKATNKVIKPNVWAQLKKRFPYQDNFWKVLAVVNAVKTRQTILYFPNTSSPAGSFAASWANHRSSLAILNSLCNRLTSAIRAQMSCCTQRTAKPGCCIRSEISCNRSSFICARAFLQASPCVAPSF